jgi:hypothetical protein
MMLTEVRNKIFPKAFKLLPASMNSPAAQVILLTIGLQESRFEFRRQLGNGPARGFWQFEKGNATSRGGVWGVANHAKTAETLKFVCQAQGVPFDVDAIWAALETDDVLACCVARLLMYTDAAKLPAVTDADGAWEMYAKRTWRPGKPHPETWAAFHAQARTEVGV